MLTREGRNLFAVLLHTRTVWWTDLRSGINCVAAMPKRHLSDPEIHAVIRSLVGLITLRYLSAKADESIDTCKYMATDIACMVFPGNIKYFYHMLFRWS